MFNYIVTIHNKEDILPLTLFGLKYCSSEDSRIFAVLDGCTDRSEEIVDHFINHYDMNIKKIITPNVHEIKSITSALKLIKNGFTISLQDDVILMEHRLEKIIEDLYQREGDQLGVVSFRIADNLKRYSKFKQKFVLKSKFPLVIETDMIEGPNGLLEGVKKGKYYKLYYRMAAIKSPTCIPENVLKTVGLLDENMAPYSWDDHEYCIRCLKAGFKNALFPIKWISELSWGGTRRDKKFVQESKKIHIRNRAYIWQKHGKFIEKYWEKK